MVAQLHKRLWNDSETDIKNTTGKQKYITSANTQEDMRRHILLQCIGDLA